MPKMRVQTTFMVGKRGSTEKSKGKDQDQDQADKIDGETWIASRYANISGEFE